MGSWDFVLGIIKIGGKRSGSYNISTGVIKHPSSRSGKKSPKIQTKQVKRK